ncbi:glycosyltransferase family 2 protein [Candidatus Saccharibacteria bacterium]|nr:glycosyltransferase family 2 protein [Candidatus Saccharibacteria bacterium]
MPKKLLTISIAAYNVEKTIIETLESLLIKNLDLLDVIIVNDGSTDSTKELVENFIKEHPGSFRLINQKNGGYGSTINASIKNATGKYFRPLDGDDWADSKKLDKFCEILKDEDGDLIITPFKTINESTGQSFITNFAHSSFSNKKIDAAISELESYVPMHCVTYKTSLLQKNQIALTRHCFYTDTEYVLLPFKYAKTVSAYNLAIYLYRFGTAEQSVSPKSRARHYEDMITVTKRFINDFSSSLRRTESESYINDFVIELCARCFLSFLFILKPTKAHYTAIKKYLKFIDETDPSILRVLENKFRTVRTVNKGGYFSYLIVFLVTKFKQIKHRGNAR